MSRLICCAFVGTAVLIAASGPSAADPLLSISYDVTGGNFPETGFGGPITGANMVITLPGSSTSSPVACSSSCGTIDILLTGPNGTFPFNSAPLKTLNVTASIVGALFTYMYYNSLNGYQYQTTGKLNYPVSAVMGTSPGIGQITGFTTTFAGAFFVFSMPIEFGNEIRLLPEPSFNTGLAAGALLLGLIGTFSARARSARLR